jgi:hypothetical protein
MVCLCLAVFFCRILNEHKQKSQNLRAQAGGRRKKYVPVVVPVAS